MCCWLFNKHHLEGRIHVYSNEMNSGFSTQCYCSFNQKNYMFFCSYAPQERQNSHRSMHDVLCCLMLIRSGIKDAQLHIMYTKNTHSQYVCTLFVAWTSVWRVKRRRITHWVNSSWLVENTPSKESLLEKFWKDILSSNLFEKLLRRLDIMPPTCTHHILFSSSYHFNSGSPSIVISLKGQVFSIFCNVATEPEDLQWVLSAFKSEYETMQLVWTFAKKLKK